MDFIGLGDMNRIELIKSLIRRSVPGVAIRPKGLFLAGHSEAKQAVKKRAKVDSNRPRQPMRSSQFGPIRPGPTEHMMDWIYLPDADAPKRERQRHQPHALTRIAERLKRGWQK